MSERCDMLDREIDREKCGQYQTCGPCMTAEITALRLRAETAEKEAAEAYAKGQRDMREAAAKEADQWTGCDLLAKEIRALPIKERP